MIFGPLVRFGLSILGTKMAAILDLVNKAWTYVAELYFIGFVDPQNISLGTKSIFLAGLEIEISQKLDLVTGHGGHFEKRIFFIVWTLLERVTRSNIFPHIKIYQKKSRNLICLIWRRKIIFFKWPKDYMNVYNVCIYIYMNICYGCQLSALVLTKTIYGEDGTASPFACNNFVVSSPYIVFGTLVLICLLNIFLYCTNIVTNRTDHIMIVKCNEKFASMRYDSAWALYYI